MYNNYNNILFPQRVEMVPDYGGLPGNICVRYTCPKCGHVVNTEVCITDLWGSLSLPCTNTNCAYTLAITHSFNAFGLVMTGAPPAITMFDAETEAQQLRETVRSQAECDVWERKFAALYWTVADILDPDFGIHPDDPRWTPERAARLLANVSDVLIDAMVQTGREILEREIKAEEAAEEKRCPYCKSSDVQLYGKQALKVVEDWSGGNSRDNFELPEEPTDEWLSCTGHCLDCGAEWEIVPDLSKKTVTL